MNNTIIIISKKAWALCIIGKGIQQLYLHQVDPIFLPGALTQSLNDAVIITWGILFTLCGLAMLAGKRAGEISFILGCIFLLCFAFGYVPYLTLFSESGRSLIGWAAAIQELGFIGASLIFSASSGVESKSGWLQQSPASRLVSWSGIFFAAMLILYGTIHFAYLELVSPMVPSWLSYHKFWTMFAGCALIAAGIAIIFRIKLKLAGSLLALMIFSWLVMLHIPRAFFGPLEIRNLETSRVIVTIGYTGIALLLALDKSLQSLQTKKHSATLA